MNMPPLPWLLSLLLLGLLSCSSTPKSTAGPSLVSLISDIPGMGWLRQVTPVSDISAEMAGSEQTWLQGEVRQQIPLLNQSLYQLQDSSGSIWVLTAGPPPAVGDTALIRVQIRYEQILLQGQDIGELYAEELERLEAPAEAGETPSSS